MSTRNAGVLTSNDSEATEKTAERKASSLTMRRTSSICRASMTVALFGGSGRNGSKAATNRQMAIPVNVGGGIVQEVIAPLIRLLIFLKHEFKFRGKFGLFTVSGYLEQMPGLEIHVVGFAGRFADAVHVADFGRGDKDFLHDELSVKMCPSGLGLDKYTKQCTGRIVHRNVYHQGDFFMKPEYLDELINRASRKAGSDSALAREIEVSKTVICDWRAGRKSCSPEDQALMAALAGLEAEAWGARAMIAKHAGTTKGAKLEAALKKACVATGAALVSSGAIAADHVGYLIRCIDCLVNGYGFGRLDSRCLS